MSAVRTALITGAGSGLGEAMARRFAEAGWRILVTDSDESRALETVRALPGAGHRALELDVTRDDHWTRTMEPFASGDETLELLVNNAGVATGGRLEETPLEDWRWVTEINLMGVVRGCHYALPLMRRQGHGHVVNVASWAGLAAAPQIAAYGTAKAGVVALSEMLRAELHGSGVGVSVLCPAFVRTRLAETMRAPDAAYARRVQRWMERSGVTAGAVAGQVFKAVAVGRFWILTHRDTRWQWRLKRWFPGLYFRLLLRTMRSMESGPER